MNGVVVVLVAAAATWAILKAIRDVHRARRRPPVWESEPAARRLADYVERNRVRDDRPAP